MATDFFERQAAARRSTAWLVGMFAAATLALAATTGAIAWLALAAGAEKNPALASGPLQWQLPLGVATATLTLVLLGSLFKIVVLRAGGGAGVAEGLGGARLYPDSGDAASRKVLNIVEEMAIASGTPTPPVFLLKQKGINAFAAGYSPSDAVIGVTEGAVESLSRDELQGVIAHEFSHILNGDMRMSIRLIGVLHGILLLGLIGQMILRTVFHSGAGYDSRRSGSDGSGKGGSGVLAVLAIAVALIVIGSVGSLIGGLIKAAVSRQREYLADASAVQFTRNPGGIAGALKRIGGAPRASRVSHPRAAELSHMYFTQGIWEGFSGLMATHPPLVKRILAIEPTWDGTWAEPVGVAYPDAVAQASAFASGAPIAGLAQAVDDAVEQVGEPTQAHRQYAAELIAALPEAVVASAREPYGARAVLYGLLLDEDRAVRQKQYDTLREIAEPGPVKLMLELLPDLDGLDKRARLPLVDLAMPALAAMSHPQYQRFSRAFRALVAADERLSLFEWTLSQVLLRHLRPKYESVRSPLVVSYSLAKKREACEVVLSAIASSGHEEGLADEAFLAASKLLPEIHLELLPRERCGLDRLRDALAELVTVSAKHRGRLVDAAAEAICADGKVSIAEAELLRGISDLLDCPMPPLLPGQAVEPS